MKESKGSIGEDMQRSDTKQLDLHKDKEKNKSRESEEACYVNQGLKKKNRAF